MEIASAILQAQGGGSLFDLFIPMVLIMVVFWFLLIRPQVKKQKQHMAMVNAVARGDTVTTGGGLIGKVMRVQDNIAEVEIASGVTVQVVKQTLSAVEPKNKPKAETAKKKK